MKIKASNLNNQTASSFVLSDSGRSSTAVFVMGTNFWFHLSELFHFPLSRALLRCIHEGISFSDYMLVSHSRSACVGPHTLKTLHLVVNSFVKRILNLLNSCSLIFILMTHNWLHGGWGTIRSSKCILNVININCGNDVLFLNSTLAWSLYPDLAIQLVSHLVLVNTSCHFIGCRDFVESFEILVINFWWFQWLFLVNPFRGHYT